MQITKKFFAIVALLIAIEVSFSISGAVVATAPADKDTIHRGIYINKISVGGLTKEEALHKLTRELKPGLYDFQLKYGTRHWNPSFDELGLQPDYAETIDLAFGLGREANPIYRYLSILKLSRKSTNLPLSWKVNQVKSQAVLKKIGQAINRPSVNASVVLQNNQIQVLPGKSGYRLQVAQSVKALIGAVDHGEMTGHLVVEKVAPQITANSLRELKDELAVAITPLDGSDEARKLNVEKAAKYLNNALIEPGQTFSFNEQVGKRTVDRGFREAPVIQNSKITDGVGGGVCQTSSTLYQAVLLAGGFEISERHAHSLPVDYVPLGQDATVADGQLDFRFKNQRDYPVLISSYVTGDQLVVRLIGKQDTQEKGQSVKLMSDVVETLEPALVVTKDQSLHKGVTKIVDPGAEGYRVRVYRVSTKQKGASEKRLVSTSYYHPQNQIVRVGTADNIKSRRHK